MRIAKVLIILCLVSVGSCSSRKNDQLRSDGAVRLTTPPANSSDQNPAFSPDGAQILFTRFENGYNEGPSALYLFDFISEEVGLLSTAPDSDNVNLPGSAWNATLSRIVFSSDRECQEELWTIRPNGSGVRRLTCHSSLASYREPSWSPDGQWVVYEIYYPLMGGEIWKFELNSLERVRLTGIEEFDARQPNWSPDGEYILFQRRDTHDDPWDIYTMPPDGGDLQNVTNDPLADDSDASWSPDGEWIVYSSDHGEFNAPQIFVIPAGGGEIVRVTHAENYADSAPSWSPDGKWIIFEARPAGDEETPAALWRIAVPRKVNGGLP